MTNDISTIDHDYSPDSKSMEAGAKETAVVRVGEVEVEIDVAEEAAVLRKVDLYILPIMCVTFWLQVRLSVILSAMESRQVAANASTDDRAKSFSLPFSSLYSTSTRALSPTRRSSVSSKTSSSLEPSTRLLDPSS